MLKNFLILFFMLLAGLCFATEPVLKDYDEYQIPAGYHIPIMSLQEFSTAYTEEGEILNFITTNDIYLYVICFKKQTNDGTDIYYEIYS